MARQGDYARVWAMSNWIILEIVAVWLLTWGLIPVVLAQKSKTPSATLAWVWAILLLPVLGAVFFLAIRN